MAWASCLGPSASKLPSHPSRRAAMSSSLSTASTSPHSSFRPLVLSGPKSPFSHASNATPAPHEKWLHSIPRLLIFSARYKTAFPLMPKLKNVSSHSPPALKCTTVPLNSPSPMRASQGHMRAHWKQGRSTTSFCSKPPICAGERSVLRQFKLLSAPQVSPWPYLVFFFWTSCCSSVRRQRQPAS